MPRTSKKKKPTPSWATFNAFQERQGRVEATGPNGLIPRLSLRQQMSMLQQKENFSIDYSEPLLQSSQTVPTEIASSLMDELLDSQITVATEPEVFEVNQQELLLSPVKSVKPHPQVPQVENEFVKALRTAVDQLDYAYGSRARWFPKRIKPKSVYKYSQLGHQYKDELVRIVESVIEDCCPGLDKLSEFKVQLKPLECVSKTIPGFSKALKVQFRNVADDTLQQLVKIQASGIRSIVDQIESVKDKCIYELQYGSREWNEADHKTLYVVLYQKISQTVMEKYRQLKSEIQLQQDWLKFNYEVQMSSLKLQVYTSLQRYAQSQDALSVHSTQSLDFIHVSDHLPNLIKYILNDSISVDHVLQDLGALSYDDIESQAQQLMQLCDLFEV